MKFIKLFKEITLKDLPLVGGKNASLGEMLNLISSKYIKIPDGFAITADAYWYYLEYNNLKKPIIKELARLTDYHNIKQLASVGFHIRSIIKAGKIPADLAEEIKASYKKLSKEYHQKECAVSVRSSATAEDLPGASFAGQQETFLNVKGEKDLLVSFQKCLASLFTDRALVYRQEKGFDHFNVALSAGVQKMIRSDLAESGVIFTLDTETGFDGVVIIESSYGLGETIVKGEVVPDSFWVFKKTFQEGFQPIIKKYCGSKERKLIYTKEGHKSTKMISVPPSDRHRFSLTDSEILDLARMALVIEQHYSKRNKRWTPMDIEWAKDGGDHELYILQARPETVHSLEHKQLSIKTYHPAWSASKMKTHVITEGESIGSAMASGKAFVARHLAQTHTMARGDILVTTMTTPDWLPAMKKASAIVTEQGGRTCHAAIVSRELGIPAIVGASNAVKKIVSQEMITIDTTQGSTGFIYAGKIPFKITEQKLDDLPKLPVDLMVNISDPHTAFYSAQLPVAGVGLARIEFIITNTVKVHPLALLNDKKISLHVRKKIKKLSEAYSSPQDFFIDSLSQGIGTIAAYFYPRPVIVRFSDFKTNEYRNLLGGEFFESFEENPMLGLRGASRYYSPLYQKAFGLECKAMMKVRKHMGFKNVIPMVPFVRTVQEGKNVIQTLGKNGLISGKDDLKIFMMAEVPSNGLLIDEFCKYFDGLSIGSNDLTQLVLGVDRDSSVVAPIFNEQDPAVEKMIAFIIQGARKAKKYVGICGQGPSDYPAFAEFLMREKISSISLNPDAVIPFYLRYKR